MVGNNDKFNSLNDLYTRIYPALKTKVEELAKQKIKVKEIDIWHFCINYKWQNKKDLRIYEIVDDILNLDEMQLEVYANKNIY